MNGIKTQEFGSTGFNQLVLDDSNGQLREQLATTPHGTQLNLGHLVHQADNHRGALRGAGFELRTDACGAVCAKAGVLLITHAPAALAGTRGDLSLICRTTQNTQDRWEHTHTQEDTRAGWSIAFVTP